MCAIVFSIEKFQDTYFTFYVFIYIYFYEQAMNMGTYLHIALEIITACILGHFLQPMEGRLWAYEYSQW